MDKRFSLRISIDLLFLGLISLWYLFEEAGHIQAWLRHHRYDSAACGCAVIYFFFMKKNLFFETVFFVSFDFVKVFFFF